MLNSSIGEGLKFCFKSTVKFFLKAHEPHDAAATRPIEILSSIDGATLTRSLGTVAAGVKLIDVACKDPMTGECVDTSSSNTCLVQSR